MGWATSWAIFSQAHLVTLLKNASGNETKKVEPEKGLKDFYNDPRLLCIFHRIRSIFLQVNGWKDERFTSFL
jgi:hypothetical protein